MFGRLAAVGGHQVLRSFPEEDYLGGRLLRRA